MIEIMFFSAVVMCQCNTACLTEKLIKQYFVSEKLLQNLIISSLSSSNYEQVYCIDKAISIRAVVNMKETTA